VCHALFQAPAFFRLLTRIDAEFAAETKQRRCPKPECAGPLHVGDFPRKPRGCPASVREEYSRRLSFTCGRCNARTTPESVRFFGRRVYVAVALMLLSPPEGCAAEALEELLSVCGRTVKRWRTWWQRDFQRTAFWQSVRERFMPPVPAEVLPQGLLARFQGPTCSERVEQLLRFVCPLSTASVIK
jgi:hypothetical protein